LFVSANLEWMDYVAQKNRIAPESRVNLLGNALVLVAPKDQAKAVQIEPGFDLAGLLESGRLAVGDPDHVPAGQYAKTALEKLGVWAQVEPKLARAKDVRAALAFVERGECPYGIVYQTDAALAKNVQIVGEFPQNTHPAIVYPAAVVAGPQAEAGQRFLDFLKTPASKAVFEKYGFKVQ
jgi:molybdate transport system substrate-binding protein